MTFAAVADATFRTAPGLQFRPLAPSPSAPRSVGWDPDADFGFVEQPGGSTLTVSCETALLLFSLCDPGPLPGFAIGRLLQQGGAPLRQLLAVQLLEIQGPQGFVSGPEGLALLDPVVTSRGAQVALSADVLELAARLRSRDLAQTTLWLYTANVWPGSRALRTHAESGGGTGALGLRSVDSSVWQRHDDAGWIHFRQPSPARVRSARHTAQAPWKLYVSPQPDVLSQALGEIADGFASSGIGMWKVGRGAAGLLRSDKVVGYAGHKDILQRAIVELDARLGAIPAQGVPFAATATDGTLLSWGVDPQLHGGSSTESWRLHACRSLAAGLIDAAEHGVEDASRADHARRLATLDGLDPETFGPCSWWLEEVGAA